MIGNDELHQEAAKLRELRKKKEDEAKGTYNSAAQRRKEFKKTAKTIFSQINN